MPVTGSYSDYKDSGNCSTSVSTRSPVIRIHGRNEFPRHSMGLADTTTSESPGETDFDIHGVVRIRLIDPSPRELRAAYKLLGRPSRLPVVNPDITVRFAEDLSASQIRFLGNDQGFTDDGFYLLQEGTRRIKARIPFDQIGERCEIVCRSGVESVPLLMPIIGLTAIKRGHIPLHASAVVHDNVGLLMAGWAHCGKTTALLGFASKGAEYVGEEWVLLSDNGQTMCGLRRPLELSYSQVDGLPHLWRSVRLVRRWAFHGIGVLRALQQMVRGEKSRSSFVFRGFQKVSASLEDRLRPAITPSAIFRDRICCAGASVDKIFLFLSHEGRRIEVEPITPFEMACRVTFLVQHELTPLLQHYVAYRFAFPNLRNESVENLAEDLPAIIMRALHNKETYIVRVPYPHVFEELYEAIRPLCKPKTAAIAESAHALA